MSLFAMLGIILLTSILTCSVLCYSVFLLLKRVRALEKLLTESTSMMQNMSDTQKSNYESQKGKNPLLLILSNKQKDKGETITNDETYEGDKTIH